MNILKGIIRPIHHLVNVTDISKMTCALSLEASSSEKGMIKILRERYPFANIVAIDYDPGASNVNQVNRIKLMLSVAKKNLECDRVSNKEIVDNILTK